MVQPSWSKPTWPPAKPIVSTSQAREWLGLYSDTSLDDQVTTAVDAATEKVASFVGFRIVDTQVQDYYDHFPEDGLFQLSEPGIDWTTVQVCYYRAVGTLSKAAQSRWARDETAEGSVLRWVGDRYTAVSHEVVTNPWLIRYTTKIEALNGAPVIGRVRLGVRMATQWFWANRGGLPSADARLLDRQLMSLLRSARKNAGGIAV